MAERDKNAGVKKADELIEWLYYEYNKGTALRVLNALKSFKR